MLSLTDISSLIYTIEMYLCKYCQNVTHVGAEVLFRFMQL